MNCSYFFVICNCLLCTGDENISYCTNVCIESDHGWRLKNVCIYFFYYSPFSISNLTSLPDVHLGHFIVIMFLKYNCIFCSICSKNLTTTQTTAVFPITPEAFYCSVLLHGSEPLFSLHVVKTTEKTHKINLLFGF